ncbi:protein-tyrosine phosphatase family protein [Sinorhizobium terangae]|uniref:Protein tyrosine phosphatase n=1 Tax=Sinorhizobium terangae TaxID=110322 RepID=A0A6N7LKP9_SINTE|nr:protein-tyrosine phosphatase family protein [Sinorhizobium terangae]MQX17405.1 protein tyrosine phosphatase [Sinorhizobium terangae]WFU46562.1 dual specificity protein phosphatase family protein [Sinorhizobium terangae]
MTISRDVVCERVKVSCLWRAAEVAREWRASHVLSLLDPELPETDVPSIADVAHRVVRMRDQENAGATQHFPDLVLDVFEAMRPVADDQSSRILVHCHAGVSRSTAFAYGLIAHQFGKGREDEAFAALLTITRKPWPNRRIVEILDASLGREGRLLAPLDAMRARYPRRIDAWHRFNLRRGLTAAYSR